MEINLLMKRLKKELDVLFLHNNKKNKKIIKSQKYNFIFK